MPTYDYRCDHCGHRFTAVQRFGDDPVEVCPNCGKRPRRLVSLPAIVFKGSGWYVTDSRKDGGAKEDVSGSPPKSTPEAKPETPKKEAQAKSDSP